MTTRLAEKARRFRDLHGAGKPFVMPNAWDIASARLLAARGFPAIATTSAGINWANGLPDGPGAAPRDVTLARHGAIARAVDLPVNGDLENGYGDTPEEVAACIRLAIEEGFAGAGIEDYTGDRQRPYYDIGLASERIAAAREAADASGIAFTLTARAECFLYGHDDPLGEAIRRLRRYREAGADQCRGRAMAHHKRGPAGRARRGAHQHRGQAVPLRLWPAWRARHGDGAGRHLLLRRRHRER